MIDFTLQIPTKMIFGRGAYLKIGEIVASYGYKKVLLVYGGQSIRKNGLYNAVTESLQKNGVDYAEMGGVRPNPTVEFSQRTADFAKEQGVEMFLAVGGGSVIDTCKYAAHAVANNAPVSAIQDRSVNVTKTMPVGVVLTIAASGSETSNSAVVTNEATGAKRGLSTQFNYPLFAVMAPELTFTLPPYQTACGIVDILMHTMERYMRLDKGDHTLVDAVSEALCRSVIDAGRKALAKADDYDARATLMLAGSWSHNGLTGAGAETNMSAHKLEHEMSAIDPTIAHGAGLAVVWPAYLEYEYKYDLDRLAKYARNIWGCTEADDAAAAKAGIAATRAYFKELGMPSTLLELGLTEKHIDTMATRALSYGGDIAACKPITKEDAVEIYKHCL